MAREDEVRAIWNDTANCGKEIEASMKASGVVDDFEDTNILSTGETPLQMAQRKLKECKKTRSKRKSYDKLHGVWT